MNALTPFKRNLWVSGLLIVLFSLVFVIYVLAEKKIDVANNIRYESLLIAHELRQSSEDLTRMARIYTITANPIHKEYFYTILDIRDGKKPRPKDYHKPYWLIVLGKEKPPSLDSNDLISFNDLIKQKNLTTTEILKLQEAKDKSDLLAIREVEAINLVTKVFPNVEANRKKAREMLNDSIYFQSQSAIMKAISEFYEMVDNRTLGTIHTNERNANIIRTVLILIGLGLFLMLFKTYNSLQKILGGSIDSVQSKINTISLGDFSNDSNQSTIPENSVLHWLMEMQNRLHRIIIKQKQAEEVAKDNLAFFEAFFYSNPTASAINRISDGALVNVNEKFLELIGYPIDEVIGRTSVEIGIIRDLKKREERMTAFQKQQPLPNFEVEIITKSGEIRHCLGVSTIATHKGESLALTHLIDITHIKKTEEEFKKAKENSDSANRAKSEFIASMSHEIRTPLNGVIGFTDLLMKTTISETQSQYLSIIYRSANSLLDLLNDILDFSKIEAGKVELSIGKVDIFELIEQVSDIIKYKALEKKIQILLSISPTLPRFIYCDSMRLKQILINLLGNAVKFTEQGEIKVILEIKHKFPDTQEIELLVSVRDTGIGISKESQQIIFEAFSQEDSSTTRKYGGTGLGLTISNKLLGLMNSKLELESEQGRGSKFYFTVKVKIEEDESKNSESNQMIPGQNENEKSIFSIQVKILVVDDDEINLFLAKSILHQLIPNSIMLEAANGLEAIEQFRKEKPDIILMDIQMPVMNGYEATIEIRKIEQSQKIPIIALSAGTLKQDIEKCFQVGMNDFEAKPIVKKTFEKILFKWLIPVNSTSNL